MRRRFYQTMNKVLRAHIAVIIVNLIYGANFTIAKTIMPSHIKPLGFIILRVAVSLVLFFAIAPFFTKEKVEKKDFPLLALCGFFGVAINQMLFFKGLALTFPINGSIIMTTTPILVLIIAAVLIKEKITWQKSFGILLGASGALILLLKGKEVSFHSDTFLGDMFIFLNALSYGIFLVISKPLLKKYRPITVIKWCFFFGIFIVVPFGWSDLQEIQWSTFGFRIWATVAFVVIGVTFFAYFLNTVALETLSPPIVSSYIYLQPVLATLIALSAERDKISLTHIASTVLIFTGVYLVSIAPSRNSVKLSA